MELLIRLDDLGFSEGVNYGIEKVVQTLSNVSVGMMINMSSIQHGYQLVKDYPICLGLHLNMTLGNSLCRCEDIPSLVNAQGEFHSSSAYRALQIDACIEDAKRECEAQYQAFINLTGNQPTYIDVHAIQSNAFVIAAKTVAAKHNVLFSEFAHQKVVHIKQQNVFMKVAQHSMMSTIRDLDDLYTMTQSEKNILIFHPGYADAYLLQHSSLHVHRCYDVETLVSSEFHAYLQDKHVKLKTYLNII